VFAIAITLLVLDLGIPKFSQRHSLWVALGQLWPHYGAYAVSFMTIGIMWANHHALMHQVQKVGSVLGVPQPAVAGRGLLHPVPHRRTGAVSLHHH
jgi:uncharacterized membrane protein